MDKQLRYATRLEKMTAKLICFEDLDYNNNNKQPGATAGGNI